MQNVFGGVTADLQVAWPATLSGWLLLLCYGAIFGLLLFRGRRRLTYFSWKQWLLLMALSIAGLLLGRLEPPIPLPETLADHLPASVVAGQTVALALLSAVPYLLTGAFFGPIPALLVGFFSGLGRMSGLSHALYVPFAFAFAAWIAASMLGLWYRGRSYRILRSPLVSGPVGQTSTAVFAALAALSNSTGLVASLDAGAAAFQAQFWPMLIEGVVSGTVTLLLLRGMSQWLPRQRLRPSPSQRSISHYLKTNVVIFGGLMMLFGTAFVIFLSTSLASRALVTELAASSNTVAAQLEDLRGDLEDALAQSRADADFVRGDKASAARGLGRMYRNAQYFSEVLLIDEDYDVIYAYPATETAPALAENEQAAVGRALEEGLKSQTVADVPDRGRMLSLVVPVTRSTGQPARTLVGRVLSDELSAVMKQSLIDDSSGWVLDGSAQVLSHSGPGSETSWSDPQDSGAQNLFVPAYLGGEAFLVWDERDSRDIYYLTPANQSAWRVAATAPYENVMNKAFGYALPVLLALVLATAVFYTRFASYGQNLAGPISELAHASRTIAAGGSLTTSVDVDRQDEVGELGRAFTEMQRALKGRLDELSLLLEVSQDISTSININQSMPVLLQGAIRGTGAVGARAVILNPRGRAPIAFAKGPVGEELAIFDRTLMSTLRNKKDLAFGSPQRIGQLFGIHAADLPVKALFAIPLQINNKFQGVFYLGYREARTFDSSEQNLLHTLAGQAAVLVENAHLYARAESGRQRLQAVLSSTTEAVIVTDQTERIFMLNKAMEEAFHLTAGQVVGRAIGDVIQSQSLVKALTQNKREKRILEIRGQDERTYIANISPIVSRGRRLMGRVAVLHDVTRYKEADSLKSEFVSNVSHDLKTPLTIIGQSASELGMSADLTEEQKGLTNNIIAAVDRIVRFVDTMLDIERLEAGTELVITQFDVGEMLEELAVDQWFFAQSGGLTIRTKVARGLPKITADRAALYQAVENYLSNAIKYAPESGEILLAAVRQENQVVISLRDKGPGIADQDQIHLFEKGYRVKRHGSGKAKGSGMGLAYVKTAAERHGGQAWCESTLGKGSTFFIAIPLTPES